jgi:glycosyltransferase involved in cell wall biosynthesis
MTFHRSLGFETARLGNRVRNALAALQCGAIVTASRERRQHFLDENYVNAKKVVRIPFGVDTQRFRPDSGVRREVRRELGLQPDTPVVGAIGHFGPEKGLDQVVRNFVALTARKLPGEPFLVLVGDGSPAQREVLEGWSRQVPGRVFYAGFRNDVERWLQAWDVFVHLPRLEAFGLVVAEAMATGLPVVATAVGGLLDLVRNGITGFLVPPNSPEAAADALERLLLDPALRESMAYRARQVAQAEFSMDLCAQRYLHLYQDLQANRPPHGIDDGPNGTREILTLRKEGVDEVGNRMHCGRAERSVQ